MSKVGENIRARRKALGMSQVMLSRASGISQSAISDIENPNVTKLPNIDTISKIAAALACSVDELTGESPKTEKAQEIPSDPLRASIIRDYDLLPPEARQLVRQYIDLLTKR